jgi:transcriptional regulator with XRE-family HTH domain
MNLDKTVEDELKKRKKTQKWLAEKLDKTEAELSKWLNENKPMQEDEVVHLSQILNLPLPKLLLLASAARCAVRVKEANKIPEKNAPRHKEEINRYKDAQREYNRLLQKIAQMDEMPPVTRKRDYISLESFPDMIVGPWTVIIGDRRERPSKGIGDLVGLSVASSDFMFLHKLPLPSDTTIVRSDKILLIASKASIAEIMKTNLLIIGSPAVSLGTREVLRDVGATFMFDIGDEIYDREHKLYETVGYPTPKDELDAFISKKDVQEELDDLLATFRKNGFVDPIDFKGIRGRSIPKDEDYGMVALARNPWSEKHIACICAGVHGGGTAGAVEMLASPKNFVNCPWGGVFKVSVSGEVPWERRFEHLSPRWETHEYDPNKYLTEIQKLISRFRAFVSGNKRDDEIRHLELSEETLMHMQELASWLAQSNKKSDSGYTVSQ